ncbi:MAG: 5-bromo-4-chloroindolyl phosphate hydrolysis family protein [Mogibacterium sp.]|nr:5-bromo-4-chloroindolyl phosphate hydrolysis family protein [Mogibacterium sp.]
MDYLDEMLETSRIIMDAVNSAVEQNDYRRLNQDIQRQVYDLTNEINRYNERRRREGPQVVTFQMYPGMVRPQTHQQPAYIQQNHQSINSGMARRGTPFLRINPRYSNAAFKSIFGITGLCVFVPLLFSAMGIAGAISIASAIPYLAIGGFGAAASIRMLRGGQADRQLINEFYKYSRLVGNAEYVTISQLASLAGETYKTTLANLEAMIKAGMLPQAHLDEKKTTLMLTEEVYQQYLQAEGQKVETARKEAAEKAAIKDEIDELDVSEDVKKTIREGRSFIQKVQKYNDQIPDEEMTAKLDHLKMIVDRIFEQVKKNPKSAGDLNKFMNYYLPTTEKLITAYIDLDKQPMSSKNVADTKKEIEGAMDIINTAFENLFDSMFEEVAWDISSDISAMKTMMAQDGLTEEGVVRSTK